MEAKAIACSNRESPDLQIDDRERRSTDYVPAAGRLPGVDPGLPTSQCDGTGWHANPRHGATPQASEVGGQISRIRKTRQEADREDTILRVRVRRDDNGLGQF